MESMSGIFECDLQSWSGWSVFWLPISPKMLTDVTLNQFAVFSLLINDI